MRPEGGGGAPVVVQLASGGIVRPPPSLWRTPTPYIFLGLTFLMGLIAVALLVLLCTRRIMPSRRGADDDEERAVSASPRAVMTLAPLHREGPKVVFMPGDRVAPSFVASTRPLAASVVAPGAGARAAAVS